ncbi:MAG: UDP-N-acetylglucosamine 4,6-dehydratase (inverting) [Gammaproteobacteria bacterium]|nr:UDP-N-acetylglucosamine 4,6-dehydratase (inverting) [Gammaproteobacteria bacterium]
MDLNGKTILITGGTGSFGQKFIELVTERYTPKRLIIFSRDELKQFEMSSRFPKAKFPFIRYFIGDVRDLERLRRAFDGVDVLIHAAALKQVDTCEYNPFEAVKTNVNGSANVIDAALDCGVKQVINLSTDKAANPINLYGATKLCADKMFVAANNYSGTKDTRFSVVRYGNVVASRGSVVPLFLRQKETGSLTITDPEMTRFWISLEEAVEFVLTSLGCMRGGEIFVPKIPSVRITDLAQAIAPECEIKSIGIRPGEKLHEVMVSRDDARNTIELDDRFVIHPSDCSQAMKETYANKFGGKCCSRGFEYSSENNDHWLTVDDLKQMVSGMVI